jgi:hypothetical protein
MLSKTMKFRPFAGIFQQRFKVSQIIVTENHFLAAGLPNTFYHRIMVESVRKDETIRHQSRDSRNTGFIGNIAGRENESCFLVMKIGKLPFEFDQGQVRAGNVTGAAGTGPHTCCVSTIAPMTFGCCDIPR